MSASDDFDALKARVAELNTALQGVSEQEWQAYIKVRDILGAAGGPQWVSGGETAAAEAAAAESVTSTFTLVHKCAMVGLFEPALGSGTSGAYDVAAVHRFAELGG